MKATTTLLILTILAHTALSLSLTEKTPETLTVSFKRFDKDKDGFLSETQVREYFYKQYMKDFEGIDIDEKFTDSTFQYILGADEDDDGIELQEFIDTIIPKKDAFDKREPGHYPEQDL